MADKINKENKLTRTLSKTGGTMQTQDAMYRAGLTEDEPIEVKELVPTNAITNAVTPKVTVGSNNMDKNVEGLIQLYMKDGTTRAQAESMAKQRLTRPTR